VGFLNKGQQEEFYNEIVRIYDLSEGLLDAIEHHDVKNHKEQLKITEPIVEQVEESVGVLSDVYLEYVENGEVANEAQIRRVETAIRKMFVAISNFNDSVKELKAG